MKKVLILLVILLVSINNFRIISENKPKDYGNVTLVAGETYEVGTDVDLGNYLVNIKDEEVTFSLTYDTGEESELVKYNNESFIIDPSIVKIKVDKKTTLNKRY